MIEYTYRVPDQELPAPLPTLAEIHATPKLPAQHPLFPSKACLIRPHFIVKHDKRVRLLEVENMLFVRRHSDLVVPKPYAAYTDTDTGENYIVMEYIPGATMGKVWGKLDQATRDSATAQLRRGFDQLRSVHSPGYLGCLNGKEWMNSWLAPKTSGGSAICTKTGPLTSGYDWVEIMLREAQAEQPFHPKPYELYRSIYHELLDSLSDQSKAVFTHGDLNHGNIFIREGDNAPVVLDWEVAAFCPPYQEYLILMHAEMRLSLDTTDFIPRVLDPYLSLVFLIGHYMSWCQYY